MNIESINNVINYIEDHITETLDAAVLAKVASSSPSELQRVFGMTVNMSLAEYIRKRRMTLAGAELKHTDISVTDAALKYGYNSPISFTRAFRAFHGFNPSRAKDVASLPNSFPRINLQMTIRTVAPAIRTETLTVAGRKYRAEFFGESDMSEWSSVYRKRLYWRITDPDSLFEKRTLTNEVLPYNNYPPIAIEEGQIFIIDYYRKESDTVDRKYYIADGTVWLNMPSTREFLLKTP